MSSEIEYRHLALAFLTNRMSACWEQVTGQPTWSLGEDNRIYVVLAEHGSSNTTMTKWVNGRPKEVLERKWGIAAIGSTHQVIAHACRIASFAHSGVTRLRSAGESGWVTPEAYIRHYRNTVSAAIDGESHCIIGDLRIRFFDAENRVRDCPWLTKAVESGRLTLVPRAYIEAGKEAQFDHVLQLSPNSADGMLACDLHALSGIFAMRSHYPHFYFVGGIDDAAERAYDRTKWERKQAA
ncbi:MAG: hypothetical protein BGP25_05050 [Lysobacterales bacterium 63-13]|nr:MAG: hypothetical protein BGP25_05050 [Xanthomonadales bacterium 63-13]